MTNPQDDFKSQIDKILKIDNEEVNPFGRPYSELTLEEKEQVLVLLNGYPANMINRAKRSARARNAKEKKLAGTAVTILLGKFNQETEKLIVAKAKELGLNYPSSLLNDAIEDFLGIPRGSSLPPSWKNNR